jgi:hypothetical protein
MSKVALSESTDMLSFLHFFIASCVALFLFTVTEIVRGVSVSCAAVLIMQAEFSEDKTKSPYEILKSAVLLISAIVKPLKI